MKIRLGFTLLELMVVVGVIAILVALMFPAYRNMLEKGRNTQCKANLRSLWRGAMAYTADLPEIILKANQAADGSIVGQYDTLPPRLPQYWVFPTPITPGVTTEYLATNAGWRGSAGLNAITQEVVHFSSQNFQFTRFPTLFRYVDRDVRVYSCPTYLHHMRRAYPGNTNRIYRNYIINQRVCGSAMLPNNLADLGKLSTRTQSVQFVLFSEMGMPLSSDYGPSAALTSPTPSNFYHNARNLSGMSFTKGSFNAIYLDGHIEAITNQISF